MSRLDPIPQRRDMNLAAESEGRIIKCIFDDEMHNKIVPERIPFGVVGDLDYRISRGQSPHRATLPTSDVPDGSVESAGGT